MHAPWSLCCLAVNRAALINTVHEKLGTLSPNTTQPAGIAALLELVATAAPGTNMMNTLRGDVVVRVEQRRPG